MNKTFRSFGEMITTLRKVSFSLDQSFGVYIGGDIDAPDQLRACLENNQAYYIEDGDTLNQALAEAPNAYWTGGGVHFTWDIHVDQSVTCTLLPCSADGDWHKNSRLLANAWHVGFRGELPFLYNHRMALTIHRAVEIQDALHIFVKGAASLDRCLTAIANHTLLELMIEVAQEEIAERKAFAARDRTGYDDYDDVVDTAELLR